MTQPTTADLTRQIIDAAPSGLIVPAVAAGPSDTMHLITEFSDAQATSAVLKQLHVVLRRTSSFEAELTASDGTLPVRLTFVPPHVILAVVAQAVLETRELADSGSIRGVGSWRDFTTSVHVGATASAMWSPVREAAGKTFTEMTEGLPLGRVPEVSPVAHTLAVLLGDAANGQYLRSNVSAVTQGLLHPELAQTAMTLHDDPVAESRRPTTSTPKHRIPTRPRGSKDATISVVRN